jgi:hypothetical protein
MSTGVEGYSFNEWPQLKIGRARQHGTAIMAYIHDWSDAVHPMAVTDNERVFELALNVVVPPPIEQLGLMFGDFLHNLRSALDALAWNLCTQDGKYPDNAHQVTFPVLTKPGEWGKKATLLQKAGPYLQLLHDEQPIHRAPHTPKHDPLAVLAKLNNDDKHRELVLSGFTFEGNHPVVLLDPSGAKTSAPEYTITALTEPGDPIVTGAPLVRLEFDTQLPKGHVLETGLRMRFEVSVNDVRHGIGELMGILATATQETVTRFQSATFD